MTEDPNKNKPEIKKNMKYSFKNSSYSLLDNNPIKNPT
jgi:hypothetical protein